MTETQLRTYVSEKLKPGIEASEHIDVENAIIDFIISQSSLVTKSKIIDIESWTSDRNYSVSTGLLTGFFVETVHVMLVCKVSNNGFIVGDVVTAPTPYLEDGSRTYAQGIGVQFNTGLSNVIKVMTNDQITFMTSYNSASNAVANNIAIKGSETSKWAIRLIVFYK